MEFPPTCSLASSRDEEAKGQAVLPPAPQSPSSERPVIAASGRRHRLNELFVMAVEARTIFLLAG